MDKRGTKLLLAMLICSTLIGAILIYVYQLSQTSCDLVFIEPEPLGHASFLKLSRQKPIKASDSSLLVRISAYLEYNIGYSDSTRSNSVKIIATNQTGALSNQQQQPQTGPITDWTGIALGFANSSALRQPQPQFQPQNGETQQQQVGLVGQVIGQLVNQTNGVADNSINKERRFLPLNLERIEAKQLNDEPGKFKYILELNCTKITMIFVRLPDRVHVERISLDLHVENRRKSKCDLRLPAAGAFNSLVGPASRTHYQCSKAQLMRFACFESGSSSSQNPLLWLQMHSFEYQALSSPNSDKLGANFDTSQPQTC